MVTLGYHIGPILYWILFHYNIGAVARARCILTSEFMLQRSVILGRSLSIGYGLEAVTGTGTHDCIPETIRRRSRQQRRHTARRTDLHSEKGEATGRDRVHGDRHRLANVSPADAEAEREVASQHDRTQSALVRRGAL